MSKPKLLLGLTLLGCLVPFGTIVYIITTTGGFDFVRLLSDSLATPYTTFVSLDLLVTGIVFLGVYIRDWRAGRLDRLQWLPLILTFSLGICAGLPCYLYLRETSSVSA